MNIRWYNFLFFSLSVLQIMRAAESHTFSGSIHIDASSNNDNNLENRASNMNNQEKQSHKEQKKIIRKNKTKKTEYPQSGGLASSGSCQTDLSCGNKNFIFNVTKKEAIIVGIVVAYVSMFATLYGMAYTCHYYCPWAHWKNDLSVRQLRKLPEKKLATELFAVLNTMYECEHKQGDFLTPLVCFINAIDREIAWHRRFLSLHAWLDYCLIFPKQQSTQLHVTEQYERLKLIRSILVTWLTSYTNDDIQHVAQ